MQRITQSMAGRTAVMSLLPLSTKEILSVRPDAGTSEMLLCEGYPAICGLNHRDGKNRRTVALFFLALLIKAVYLHPIIRSRLVLLKMEIMAADGADGMRRAYGCGNRIFRSFVPAD